MSKSTGKESEPTPSAEKSIQEMTRALTSFDYPIGLPKWADESPVQEKQNTEYINIENQRIKEHLSELTGSASHKAQGSGQEGHPRLVTAHPQLAQESNPVQPEIPIQEEPLNLSVKDDQNSPLDLSIKKDAQPGITKTHRNPP